MSDLRSRLIDPATRAKVAQEHGLLPQQTTHRINILQRSGIKDGDKILEIGCGQGDCTSVLAMLYPDSHITAIDPGSLDYGDPETLGQAHARIKSYDFGDRITFVQSAPTSFLAGTEEGEYDVGILCHCLWYFSSKSEVLDALKTARRKVKKLCVAEWSLQSGSREADVHVLTALARGCCEAHIPTSLENIRTPLSPKGITELAREAGWSVVEETTLTPDRELQDAVWEMGMLVANEKDSGESVFMKRARREIEDERVHTVLESMLESVKSSVDAIGGKQNVRCMDVWVTVFEQ